MPFIDLEDSEDPQSFWRTMHQAPFNGDVRLKVKPFTSALRAVVMQRAKTNPLNQRHQVTIDGIKKTVNADRDSAFEEEFLKAIIDEWQGVKGDPPCDDEHKVKLRKSPMLVLHLLNLTQEMAGADLEDEEKN